MAARVTRTKSLDSKGRLTLGERFANKTVLVRRVSDDQVVVTLARVIPEREAWLFDNPKAKASVRRGLSQAKARRFSKTPPDLAADAALTRKLADS